MAKILLPVSLSGEQEDSFHCPVGGHTTEEETKTKPTEEETKTFADDKIVELIQLEKMPAENAFKIPEKKVSIKERNPKIE